MKMKKLMLMALSVVIASSATTQKLKLEKFIPSSKNPQYNLGLTFANKPNGIIFRLREERAVDFLKPAPKTCNMLQMITGTTEFGYYALYRKELGADDYSSILTLYNKKAGMFDEMDLNEVSGNFDCELQDLRYEDGRVYYNFACPSYSSELNGTCSSLYCLDIAKKKVLWKTPHLISNGIFIISGNCIVCGHGVTHGKDYIHLIDKATGKVLSKVLIRSASQYIEAKDGHIYVIDYQENGYDFVITQ
ncbi:MAG: hypothetical protein PUH24_08790 [Prevotellaceae bacterium]|nr:hypothetical protein [Prevotella sp.]MDD7258343.1 hypothetical protein [Prevotellaceae bacterium]MDY6129901.1 hypothetical protein [Prevotella sp.]